MSKRGDEERSVVRNRDADLDARKYGYKSWKALDKDFKEQKKMIDLNQKRRRWGYLNGMQEFYNYVLEETGLKGGYDYEFKRIGRRFMGTVL